MKALIIAGGIPQVELIKQLKKRGIFTLLADGSPNAIAKPVADAFFHVDVFNTEAIKEIAIKEKVDFIITVCADQVLLVVAKVSEELGLPCYIDYVTSKNVSDKLKMKRIFVENNIPTTKYIEISSFDLDKISQLKFPLIVKPNDTYSSKGVRRANDLNELYKFYKEAKEISRSGNIIIEEFFEGEELSIDAFVQNGKAQVICISNSDKVKDKDRFVIFRGRYPSNINNNILIKINEITQKIADVFHLFNSPLLIQVLVNQDKISVLEFCARTGGNMKYLLIKYSSGIDVISATIDITLGENPDLIKRNKTFPVVVNDFIYCKPGIFDHFEGFDELIENGTINEFHPVRVSGTEMKGVTCSSDRIAGINITAKTKEEYNQKLKKINESVKVIDKNGKDIMRHDLLSELI